MQTRIRVATPADLTAICCLGNEINVVHHLAEPDIFLAAPAPAPAPAEAEAFWQATLARADVGTYVAEVASEVIGFVTLALGEERSAFTHPVHFAKVIALGGHGKLAPSGRRQTTSAAG